MKAIITLFISICIVSVARSQTDSYGELRGRVYDSSTNEGIPFAAIYLQLNGVHEAVGETDEAGYYTMKSLLPGSYDLRTQYRGYRNIFLQGINIVADRISFQNVSMQAGECEIVLTYTEITGITPAQGNVRYVNCTPVRSNAIDQNATAASTDHYGGGCIAGSAVTQNDVSSLVVASSRENASVYYLDGIRVCGSIPTCAIEQITVITGGLPAKYEYVNSENDFSPLNETGNSLPTPSPPFCLIRGQW